MQQHTKHTHTHDQKQLAIVVSFIIMITVLQFLSLFLLFVVLYRFDGRCSIKSLFHSFCLLHLLYSKEKQYEISSKIRHQFLFVQSLNFHFGDKKPTTIQTLKAWWLFDYFIAYNFSENQHSYHVQHNTYDYLYMNKPYIFTEIQKLLCVCVTEEIIHSEYFVYSRRLFPNDFHI